MADNGDMTAHTQTYGGFLGVLKWGSAVTALVVAFVIFMIAG